MAIGTTAVLIGSAAALHSLISAALRSGFDDGLLARANSLAALVELSEDGLEFDPPASPEYAPSGHAAYYQIWRPDGGVLARSASLAAADLDRPIDAAPEPSDAPGAAEQNRAAERRNLPAIRDIPAYRDVHLPDGRAGRTATITFSPRQEFDDGRAAEALRATLTVACPTHELDATLARVRAILIGVCLAAVLLSLAVSAWVVSRGVRPIAALSEEIAGIGDGDLSRRISAADAPRELLSVVERLNDLLSRLQAAFDRERRFTGDVAHELRTPLAGLRSKLELALARDRSPAAYQSAIGDSLVINLQMQRLVENLLHLARADAGQLEVRREPLDVSRLIEESWRAFESRATSRRLKVEWRLAAAAAVDADRESLRLAIQNILDNAVQYADDGGRLTIETTADDGSFRLAVANTGNRVPPDQCDRVFDRFWRADPTSPESAGHYGLGLPLCKAVIERLGGDIRASCPGDGVFRIEINLRRSES